jgi:hypothetical protein
MAVASLVTVKVDVPTPLKVKMTPSMTSETSLERR